MQFHFWQLLGLVFSLILGTLLHFTYEWSGRNDIVGLFSATNESTFEHLKLIFTPIFLFSIIEYFVYGKNIKNFVPIKIFSIILGIITVIVLFYTYTGIIGRNYFILDISIFVIAILIAYIFSNKFLNTDVLSSPSAFLASYILIALLIWGVIVYSVSPPNIGLFNPPNK